MFLKREIVAESPFVQDLLKECEERAEARGEAKGAAAALRQVIRDLVNAKCPALVGELRAIDRIGDLAVLQEKLRELALAKNAAAVRRVLQSNGGSRRRG